MAISAEISNSCPSAGAGVSSQGVTSSVGPVGLERGNTGTDSCSKLGKERLGGETGDANDCLRITGESGLKSEWEGPGESSQGVTSSTGPVLIVRGAEDGEKCAVGVDEDDLRFFRLNEDVEVLKSLVIGDAGTG